MIVIIFFPQILHYPLSTTLWILWLSPSVKYDSALCDLETSTETSTLLKRKEYLFDFFLWNIVTMLRRRSLLCRRARAVHLTLEYYLAKWENTTKIKTNITKTSLKIAFLSLSSLSPLFHRTTSRRRQSLAAVCRDTSSKSPTVGKSQKQIANAKKYN